MKRYNINYGWQFDCIVDIDPAILTDEKLHEINNFWSGAEERIIAHGDVLHAVLTMLGMTAFNLTLTELDADGKLRRGEIEGWPALDGSWGITLVSLDDFELDSEEITVKEID